jgi:predicted translin family RNA/ssDNA-binding protein
MLSQVVMGGTEVGEDLGYGPARYFEPKLVLDIVGELTRAGLEAEMQGRFDPAQMTNEKIYPFQWNAADLTWVMDGFHRLRQLFADAAAAHEAVLTVID